MTDLTTLSRMLDEATGPSRELDAYIQAFVEDRDVRKYGHRLLGRSRKPPHDECVLLPTSAYTASTDAALALAERVLPGWDISITRLKNGRGYARFSEPPGIRHLHVGACNPPIAIIRAVVAVKMQEDNR